MCKKSIIFSQKGASTLLSTVILSSIVLLGGIFMINKKENILLSSIKNNLKNEAAFITKEGLALSSFFVANNLVICRKMGWESLEKKCRWGGSILEKEILMSQFQFKKLKESETSLVMVKNVTESGIKFQLKLSFDLINTANSTLLGNLSDTYSQFVTDDILGSEHDKDEQMVLIRSEVTFLNRGGLALNKSQALIRRPMAHISMTVTKANVRCSMSCKAGQSNSPYAECRSKAFVPTQADGKATTVPISLTFKNKGPGLIYSLLAKKQINRHPSYFPNSPSSEVIFQALPAGDKYKLAGTNWTVQDTHDCISPTTIIQTRRVAGRHNGTATSVSQHGSEISSVNYSLLLEGTPTLTPSKTRTSLNIPSLAWSLFFPKAMATVNSNSLQSMDPARALSLSTLVSSKAQHITIHKSVTITYIPPH